jgi:hypothetical protein
MTFIKNPGVLVKILLKCFLFLALTDIQFSRPEQKIIPVLEDVDETKIDNR